MRLKNSLSTVVIVAITSTTLSLGCGADKTAEDADTAEIVQDESGDGFSMKIRGDDGENAEVEVSGDDETFSMKIQGGEGGFQMQVGQAAAIPEGFPKDVPLYDGLTWALSQKSEDGFVVQGTVKDEIDKVTAFYKEKAAAQGWVEESSFTQSGDQPLTMLNYKKDNRTLNVSIGREDDKTSVMLATGQ